MYLINALYFKSKWQSTFDKALTKQEDFTTNDNRTIKVNMMEQLRTAHFYSDRYLQCLEMPYGNEAFSMIVVLPGIDMEIDELIDYMDDKVWQNIVNSQWSEATVWLKLPRFKIECELPLNEPVMNVGMKRIFGGGFANISDAQLNVSEIKQKTFVEVNEEGTEAAAVTVIGVVGEGPGYYPFFANRPFLYLIKEKSTGTILFIGRMDEPKE
jgi:serpin B